MHCSFHLKKIVTGILILFASLTIQASPYLRCDSIPQGLNKLLSKTNPSVHVGVVVQSMDNGHIVYSKNANQLFAPASVQKLFTVSAALINLTPDFRFPTRLLTTGTINQGVLNGNLIFQFNGDTSLNQNHLAAFVKKLREMGVRRIQGNIIIDDTAFNHIPYPAGWLWNDLSSVFAAPLNTVVINRNKFGVSFIPARRLGEKPEIIPQLPPGSATFINEAKTTSYPCPVSILSNENNQYLIRGCIPKRSGIERRSLAIRNMEMFTKGLIPELLRKQDIQLNGHVLSEKTPANSQLVTEHLSAPLKELIVHLLKKSDNLYADVLFKKIGEYYEHAPGSWQNGLQAEAPILSHNVGINLNHIRLIDGAGLSRYNLATPYDISQMLSYINRNTALRETLIPALPIAGVDGTLKYRMPTLARGQLVHAKTGSMTGVSTLAGFVKTKHHGLLSFVIMVNNIPKYRIPYIVLENHIVEFLAESRYC